ncbi:MAG: hypothetical protein Q4F72_02340 [Desulfovibrionaceae bacterium]|nr:hypothetical protein [Desulfovibrionaceae bacterium]
MEKLLLKMADQLDGLAEASLVTLWHKYAKQACIFEPTKEWERATLVFCLIQAKRMKNQLFNYYWQSLSKEHEKEAAEKASSPEDAASRRRTPCPLLQFRPLPEDEDRK